MVWDMLDDNIRLRTQLNDYLEGMLDQTAQKLEHFYQTPVGQFALMKQELGAQRRVEEQKQSLIDKERDKYNKEQDQDDEDDPDQQLSDNEFDDDFNIDDIPENYS
jgi:hypothetical protein